MSDFRGDGEAALDWVAGYLERVGELPVAASVSPGEVRAKLAASPPEQGEPFEAVLRDLDEAIRRYREALERAPDDPVLHYNFALALEDADDMNAARMHYHEAVEIDPSFADAHFNLGRLLERIGRRSQALRHLLAYRRLTEK